MCRVFHPPCFRRRLRDARPVDTVAIFRVSRAALSISRLVRCPHSFFVAMFNVLNQFATSPFDVQRAGGRTVSTLTGILNVIGLHAASFAARSACKSSCICVQSACVEGADFAETATTAAAIHRASKVIGTASNSQVPFVPGGTVTLNISATPASTTNAKAANIANTLATIRLIQNRLKCPISVLTSAAYACA
jgi:hypothetical protein